MPRAHQQHLARLLARFSERLDQLLVEARRHKTELLPPELIDEMASTTGELMLVLVDYQTAQQKDDSVKEAIQHAGQLRQLMRSRLLDEGSIADEIHSFTEEVGSIIREHKRAA